MADDKKSLHKGYVHYIPAVEERDDWDKDLTFVLIRSLDELRVHDVEHDYTAWDTETSGLDPDMDYLVGFSFSFDGETGYYVPVAHDDMALGTEAVEIFYSILKKTRKSQFLFNCRFDQRFLEFALKHKGWTLDGMPYYDVQNAIWLADTNVVMPSLKASERHFLGWKPKTFDETLGDAVTFQHVPAEDAYRYACTDAVSTYQLALVSNKFYHENLPASRFDNAMLYPLMRLENTPQRLDTEYLKSLLPQVEATIERAREEVYRLAGTQFNLNAPQQFGKVLVERFGVDTGARTATGAMKADLKTIDAWMVKHNSVIGQDIKDFIKAYKEYKKTVKFKSSYLDKYIKTANEQDIYPVRFSYKTNSVPCLTENNTVLVKNKGFISIKDVTQDDMIWTAWGYRRVLWNKAHDVNKVYRVTLQNGMTIEGTDRHPVLVRKSPLESVNPRGMTKDDVEWAGLCDLKTGEPVIINHTCAASSCDNGKLCILARLMGYFYGKGRNIDGCLFTLRFVRGKSSLYYRELLVSLFGEKGVSRYDVDSKCVEYNVTKNVLSQLLEQFDLIPEIQTDSHGNKKVDNVSVYVRVAHARSILHDTFRHFLCGYLDSKGTSIAAYNVKDIPENWVDGIHKDRVVFVIPSKERDLIVSMLWAASVGCDVTEHSFQAWFGECKLTRIDIHEPYALSNLKDLWSDFDPLTERFSSIRFPKQMRLYLESEVANVEVVCGETKVYDIEVEDVHEYVANGIVTHNTGRLSCGTSAKNKFFTNNNVQSTPKPHAVMLKGRKATEQEIAEKKDILGWYFSNDIPDDDAKGLVEGMDPDHLNIRRAFLPENDQCYVVSIDMCLEGGSPVQTKCGYMGICEMKPGDEVWSPQGWVTVERIMRTGVKPVIKVYPDNGGQAIYCTENHPFILDGKQVKAKDIKGKVPRTELVEYSDDMNVFAGDSTPTSAYLLGFILCSGNVIRYVKDENTSLLLVVWSEDEQHLRLIGKVLGGSCEVRHKVTEQSEWWVLHLSRNDVCERLLSLGIPCGLTTSSDRVNFEWLGENFRHFVRGMFDAIGIVKTDEGFTPELAGDASYMTEVQKHLDGQWKYIQKFRTYLRLQGTDEQKKFIYDYLYKDATLWVQQKRDVFDTWYMENFGEWEVPVWNCTVQTQEHQLYVQGVNVHQCAEELRIVANLYHEDTWIKAFNSGADVHKACYSPDTEFYVKSHGWMYAENITPDMEIAYYDVSSDSFKFTTAGKRAKHKGREVYVRSGVFNVTDNHRMYVDFDARGYHIERADNLKNCGNAKQRFHMKTAVGTRIEFSKERNDDNDIAFALGFLSAVDKEFEGTRMIVKCSTVYPEVLQILKDDAGSSTHKTWFMFSAQGVSRLVHLGFSTSLGRVVDDVQIFSSRNRYRGFVCGLLHGLSCRKDSEMYLGDGTNVHGRAYVKDKGLADWIQWLLTCNGYSCRIQHNVRSNRYALHIESRPNKDVGMTFHSVTGHSLTDGGIYSCFEVPSGLLVTRYDGRITVNGNTAIKLFGEENYTKDARKKAKAASFGILYGSGAQGFNQSFPDMTLDECRDFMKKFKDALPAISQGQAENVAYARQHGDINTGFGRHRRVKFWLSSQDRAKQAFGERTVKNTSVQGTAADVLKIIFCRLWELVFKPYPQVKFMSTIHDEVNFSIPIELAREVIPICIRCMTIEREDWPVTLKCSLSISRTDLGSLIPFTYDAETNSYEPEWDTLEVKPKASQKPETKDDVSDEADNDVVCGVSLDEIDF